MNMSSKYKKNKLSLLRIELKNELCQFLPLIQVFKNCIPLNKSFFILLNRTGSYKNIKQILPESSLLLESIYYSTTKNLKKNLKNKDLEDLPKSQVNSFISFLIALKIKNKQKLEIRDSIDHNELKFINRFWNPLGINRENSNEKYSLKLIFPVILHSSNLIELNFARNKFGELNNNILKLCEAVKANKNLKRVTITENSIGMKEDQIKHLKEALETNSSLEILNLEKNVIGKIHETDALYIAEIIKTRSNLKILNLNCNFLGTHVNDCKFIFEGLSHNNSLAEVYFSRNKFGFHKDEDILILGELMKITSEIEVYLFNNRFELEIYEAMDERIKENNANIKFY